MILAGLDLAWGERNPDGWCLFHYHRRRCRLVGTGLVQGDAELAARWAEWEASGERIFLAVDAPLVCPNEEGSRPVDRLTQRLFRKQEAACHPCNRRLCARPLRVMELLRRRGFEVGWGLRSPKMAAEVYPHPAQVRWFGLDRTLKYKKGPVADRRREFRRLQWYLWNFLEHHLPDVAAEDAMRVLLSHPWSKGVEDRTDAVVCAAIAWWHVHHGGKRSEVLGDRETGFLLLPSAEGGLGG